MARTAELDALEVQRNQLLQQLERERLAAAQEQAERLEVALHKPFGEMQPPEILSSLIVLAREQDRANTVLSGRVKLLAFIASVTLLFVLFGVSVVVVVGKRLLQANGMPQTSAVSETVSAPAEPAPVAAPAAPVAPSAAPTFPAGSTQNGSAAAPAVMSPDMRSVEPMVVNCEHDDTADWKPDGTFHAGKCLRKGTTDGDTFAVTCPPPSQFISNPAGHGTSFKLVVQATNCFRERK